MKLPFLDRIALKIARRFGWVKPWNDPERPQWARDLWREAKPLPRRR